MDFLQIINLILTLFALLFIVLLYLRQNRLSEIERRYKQYSRELEETVSSFLMTMEDENEKFLNQLKQMYKNNQTEEPVVQLKNVPFSYKPAGSQQNTNYPVSENSNEHRSSEIGKDIYGRPQISKINEHGLLIKEVEKFLSEGYNLTEIAKKLKKGKTEIELLIKFTPSLMKKAASVEKNNQNEE